MRAGEVISISKSHPGLNSQLNNTELKVGELSYLLKNCHWKELY